VCEVCEVCEVCVGMVSIDTGGCRVSTWSVASITLGVAAIRPSVFRSCGIPVIGEVAWWCIT
jgi:hypothetical protein